MKIAVDFDGTCVEHDYPYIGQDAPHAEEVLMSLHVAGHKLFLYTMRSGRTLEEAVKWFIDRGIPLSGINSDPMQSQWTSSPKCFADLYIDDAAFGCPRILPANFSTAVVDWTKVADELLVLKTAKEKAMAQEPVYEQIKENGGSAGS